MPTVSPYLRDLHPPVIYTTMNGSRNSSVAGLSSPDLHEQILQALEIVHNPRSTNNLRQDASRYLENIRSTDEAPHQGYQLASAKEQTNIVRHYGLSLIEYAIRHRWTEYTPEQAKILRVWVTSLAGSAENKDPAYIINKIAEIWVEIAKRSWGLDWMDMDELLSTLWNGSVTQKILVLTILEALSEVIFGNDDTTAALRGQDLNRACVEIFTPIEVLKEHFPTRDTTVTIRHGSEGWLSRMTEMLTWCTHSGQVDEEQQACAVRILATFKSVISWVVPRSLVTTHAVNRICACLAVSNMPIQLVRMSLQMLISEYQPLICQDRLL